MPTFECFTATEKLTPAQKAQRSRTAVPAFNHQEFGIARYLDSGDLPGVREWRSVYRRSTGV